MDGYTSRLDVTQRKLVHVKVNQKKPCGMNNKTEERTGRMEDIIENLTCI